jgi:ubiquitin-activating enzyme E1
MELDTNLYSRQIGTYGLDVMEKIVTYSVFIYGMRGVKYKIIKS